jgi:hypothetical protein
MRDTPSTDGAGPSLTRRALLGGGAAALAATAGCAGDANVVVGKHDESESTYDLSEGALRVDAEYGDVSVGPADGDTVRVRVVKSGSVFAALSDVSVDVSRDGDTVTVQSTGSVEGFFASAPDVDILVELPAGVTVESATLENGDLTVEEVALPAETTLRTRNGDATVRNVDADLTVGTTNGDVLAEAVAGHVTGESRNGDVALRGCEAVAGASTTNGDLTVEVAAIRGDTGLESVNGDVTAEVSSDLDAAVVARSENGDATVGDLPLTLEADADSYVEGTLGEGRHELRCTTTNGDVHLGRLS